MSDNTVLTVALGVVIAAQALEAFFVHRTLGQHHKVLEWFATHIKLNPRNVPDGVPQDLRDLIGKEDAENDTITKP